MDNLRWRWILPFALNMATVFPSGTTIHRFRIRKEGLDRALTRVKHPLNTSRIHSRRASVYWIPSRTLPTVSYRDPALCPQEASFLRDIHRTGLKTLAPPRSGYR